jgi:hypothetical protein
MEAYQLLIDLHKSADRQCPGGDAEVEAENREIELYERHKAYYSYGVYIAIKLDQQKP